MRAARIEEQRLLAELQDVPAYQRLQLVRSLLDVYDLQVRSGVPEVQASSVNRTRELPKQSGHKSDNGPQSSQQVGRSGSLASRVTYAAAQYLSSRGSRAQSTEILAAIQEQGIVITGNTPVASLASILSHSPLFDNKRGSGNGYGLRRWSGEGDADKFSQPQGEETLTVSQHETSRNSDESVGIADADRVGITRD